MRAVAFCLLAFVVAASARDYPLSLDRSLLQITKLSCQAQTTAMLVLEGSGSGMATSESYCQALADAQKVIEEEIKKYIDDFNPPSSGGKCKRLEAEALVDATAKAVASAYTKVSVEVFIEGDGEACGSAFAAGDSLAVSFVEVYLSLTVKLIQDKFPDQSYHTDVAKKVDEKINQATGAAVGQASAAVMADAWAAASAEACTTGGFKDDFEEAFVKSVATATAELWATVIVELCANFDDASKGELSEWAEQAADSFSQIAGEVNVDDFVITKLSPGAQGSGSAGEVDDDGR